MRKKEKRTGRKRKTRPKKEKKEGNSVETQIFVLASSRTSTKTVDRTHTHKTWLSTYSFIRTACSHSHSLTTRRRVAQDSRMAHCGVKKDLSSQRHASHVAALATEHFYTISLTYPDYLPTTFSFTDLFYLMFCPTSCPSRLDPETLRDPRWSGCTSTAEWMHENLYLPPKPSER